MKELDEHDMFLLNLKNLHHITFQLQLMISFNQLQVQLYVLLKFDLSFYPLKSLPSHRYLILLLLSNLLKKETLLFYIKHLILKLKYTSFFKFLLSLSNNCNLRICINNIRDCIIIYMSR